MYGLRIWTQVYDFRAYDLIVIITHHARDFFVLSFLFCFVFFPVEMGNPEDEGKCPQNGHGMYLIKLSINSFFFSPPLFLLW